MKKIGYLATLILLLLVSTNHTAHAKSSYDVSLQVIDEHTAEVKITYPVGPGQSFVTALSSKATGDVMDGYRDLVSANAQDGSPRTISNNTLTTDSQIAVQPGDQKITLTYILSNTLKSDNISLFNFLLFFGTDYPQTAHIKINAPKGFDILAYSRGTNTQVTSDGSVEMDMQIAQVSTALVAKNFRVLVYPRVSSSYYSKRIGHFTVTADKTKLDQISSVLNKIDFAPAMFQKLLGATLPDKINIVVTPIKGQTAYYEPAGLFLEPNIILVDPSDLFFDVGPNDPEKTIIHELGHMALATKGIFSDQLYYDRWLDEGIAVFSEGYATDNYIIKTDQDRQTDSVLSNIKKLTLDELKAEYAISFDYNFSINSASQPINRTYSHAGLIFYNLYLRNSNTIPKLLESLKNVSGNVTCKDCDTNTTLSLIQSLSGLSKDDILYPYKNNLVATNSALAGLVIQNVDADTVRKIKNSASANVGSYIDKNAPVEEFVTHDKRQTKSGLISMDTTIVKDVPLQTNVASTSQPINIVKVKSQDERVSFFERIRLWLINLIK